MNCLVGWNFRKGRLLLCISVSREEIRTRIDNRKMIYTILYIRIVSFCVDGIFEKEDYYCGSVSSEGIRTRIDNRK